MVKFCYRHVCRNLMFRRSPVMLSATILLAVIPSVCLVQSSHVPTKCHVQDESCEFKLDVTAWNTMRHTSGRKVYIPKSDGKVYFLGTRDRVPEDEVILADGEPDGKNVFVANGSMPGPALEMYENQNITVHVTNRLFSEAFSIHWHGLEVRGTNLFYSVDLPKSQGKREIMSAPINSINTAM